MLEKIKNLSLRWKFGIVILVALFLVVVILVLALQAYLNREFEALYGTPSTKGRVVAELLADELKPIIKENIDSQEVQQTVDTYRSVYGVYGVRYVFLLDESGSVIADTYKGRVPQSLVDLNPLSEGESCKPFTSGNKKYYDCAIPLQLPNEILGAVRVGILEQNPDSPVWQTFKTAHVKRVLNRILLISLLLVILVTVLLTLAFWYLVVRRIVSISQATERMSFGDLETIVAVESQDEIGMLEDTLERMRGNLKDAIERLKRRK
jgi:HAMP domain-containing protein